MRLDFSEFHPLDHKPFTRYCFGWYGGPTRHIQLWWDYKFEYRPDQIIGRIKCKFNRHTYVGWWKGKASMLERSEPDYYKCAYCYTIRG